MSSYAPAWLRLTKHHGLGNDFLVVIDPWRPVDGDDAVRWCDRRTGVGADGLIQAVPIGGPGRLDAAEPPTTNWRMTLWNSDGGRAEISGNGLRCLAQALAERLGHDGADDLALAIETDAGPREAIVLARSADAVPGEDRVRVGMGKAVDGPGPSDRWGGLGVEVLDQVGVDVGNPHLVGFVDPATPIDGFDMAAIGPPVEADHPGGLNVHVVRVVGRRRIEMAIWERGAGVTQACGSGACAAAWAANRAGLVDGAAGVEVVMPGGAAIVEVLDDEVVLTGPAVRVAEVRVDG
ncbi:MAG: diaminopimelate epimerase [Actinomycetota bacterium]